MSVRTSVHKKFFSDFNEIWCVDRGRRPMHDVMPHDPLQGQGQGHGASEFPESALFQVYRLRRLQWELATDH